MNPNARTEGERAVRCSAWLGVAPLLRRANCCALELADVLLMAEDSEPPVTKVKSPELVMRSALAVMLGMKTCGVMVRVCLGTA